MMRLRPTLLLIAALASVTVPGAADLPSLQSQQLARGPYAEMHALLEKTFLDVDVLRVDIRFGDRTRDRLAALASGRSYSQALSDRIVDVVINTDNAVMQMEFKRNVSLYQWLEEVQKNLRRARNAGLIDDRSYRHTSAQLPRWFGIIEERGFRDGDRLLYRVRSGSLRTVLVSKSGKALLDQTDAGDGPPRVLLAGTLAPGSDLRGLLIRSLFQR